MASATGLDDFPIEVPFSPTSRSRFPCAVSSGGDPYEHLADVVAVEQPDQRRWCVAQPVDDGFRAAEVSVANPGTDGDAELIADVQVVVDEKSTQVQPFADDLH